MLSLKNNELNCFLRRHFVACILLYPTWRDDVLSARLYHPHERHVGIFLLEQDNCISGSNFLVGCLDNVLWHDA